MQFLACNHNLVSGTNKPLRFSQFLDKKPRSIEVHPLGTADGIDSSRLWFYATKTQNIKKDDLENDLIVFVFGFLEVVWCISIADNSSPSANPTNSYP